MIIHFRIRVILRVVLIGLAMGGLVYVLHQPQWYVTSAVGSLLVLALLVELIWFLERTHRELALFFSSLENGDNIRFPKKSASNRSLREIYRSVENIAAQIEEARTSKVVQYRYLQTVIDHVRVAIICYRENGQVELENRAARELFGVERIRNMKELASKDRQLYDRVMDLKPGKRELLRFLSPAGVLRLSVAATAFRLQGDWYRLISLQDIRDELEEQELESWQKLIRVLTHEIMNSVTPVSSLSNALNEMLREEDGRLRSLQSLDPGDVNDLYEGLHAISERSRGLLNFVGTYKNLTRLPEPEFLEVSLNQLVQNAVQLMRPGYEQAGVRLDLRLSGTEPRCLADPDMIERVLINLLQNSLDALEGQESGAVTVETGTGQDDPPWVEVRDNGPGIPPEILEKIFIPFFTTRKQGSGIGLSLARQIMRLHKGAITVQSGAGEGTRFRLRF